MADALTPDPAAPDENNVARQLAYTPWHEARILQQMTARMARSPYTGQADHAQRMAAMRARDRALRPLLTNQQARADALIAALALRPRDAELQLEWGLLLEESRRVAEAAAIYRDVLAAIPHHTLAHLYIARAQATLGQSMPAVEHFILGSPLAANPRAEALAAVGSTLADNDRYREAEPYLRDALKADPNNLIALYNLGLILGRTGRPEESLRTYLKLIELDPTFAEARNNAAALLHRAGRSEEALEHLRRAVRDSPGYLAAWRNLGAVAAHLGLTNELAEAQAHLRAP